MKKSCIFFALLLFFPLRLYPQCSECKSRVIRVYDFSVDLPPLTEYDSVLVQNYFNALKIAPAIADYLRGGDPTSSCLVVRGGETASSFTWAQAKSSWKSLQYMASSQVHEGDGSVSEEYYIEGSATPAVINSMQTLSFRFTVYARNGSIVVVGSSFIPYFGYGADGIQSVVNQMMQQNVGPFYEKLHEFEVDKRDSGDPYAIFYPELKFTPEKSELTAGELTKIKLVLKDCDEQLLKNRKLDLTSEFGVLNPTSVTTDANGEATVDFTAGHIEGIASIKASLEYQEPWANPEEKKTYSPSTTININRPKDAWFIFARRRFDESRYHTLTMAYGPSDNGNSFKHEDTYLFAWVKIEKHLLGYPVSDTAFVSSTKTPVTVKYFGSSSEHGGSNGFYSNEIGYIKDEGYFNAGANHVSYGKPEIYVSFDNGKKSGDTYSFNFSKLAGRRSGRYHSTREIYNIFEGSKTETDDHEADTSAAFNWNLHDSMRDTAYSNHSTDELTETTTSVKQNITWKDQKRLDIVQEKHMISETRYEAMGVKDYEKWTQDFLSEVSLYYDMKPTDIRDPFAKLPVSYTLSQNYPNPFNPITMFSYTIPERSKVTIKIFDLLGKEVETLLDEERSAGKYDVPWSAEHLPSGVYCYQIQAGKFTDAKKMVLMK